MIVLPGLIDTHVHLRTPGQTHKEDLDTGTCAAIAGGFTHVLDMPNTTPPIADERTLGEKLASIRQNAHCDVSQFLGASPTNIETAHSMSKRVVGLKIYLGETHGPLLLDNPAAAIAHMRRWPGPVAVHAEGWQLVAAIGIARLLNRHVHCCHVARKTDIIFIRQAKESGAPITCEVTPHHLWLTDADAARLYAMGYMKPTLGTDEDRQALWEHMDVVDCVASDHAPHTKMEKDGSAPPPGVPGLETTLPLMLTAVHEGRLTLDRLVELLYDGPRRVYSLPEQPETAIEIDPDETYVLGQEPLYTKCDWTPFAGQRVYGRLHQATLRGRTVYRDHQVNV